MSDDVDANQRAEMTSAHVAPTPSAMEEADRSIGFGAFKGKIWISDDFDAPMTEEELREWEKPLDL